MNPEIWYTKSNKKVDGLLNKLYWNKINIGSSLILLWPQGCPALHILNADIQKCPLTNTSETHRLPCTLQEQQAGSAGWVSAQGMALRWWWSELKDKNQHFLAPQGRQPWDWFYTISPRSPGVACLSATLPWLPPFPFPLLALKYFSRVSSWRNKI